MKASKDLITHGMNRENIPPSHGTNVDNEYITNEMSSSQEGDGDDDDEHNDAEEHSNDDDDDDDDDEEGEEDEDYDEEEEEPKLKYQRLGANVTEILRKDMGSCMAVHRRFLALGTHWGVVHILDFNGPFTSNEITKFPAHTAAITELSIDDAGDYVASCSDDGKVVVMGLWSTENNTSVLSGRPIRSVSVDPDFSRKRSQQFVMGGLAGRLEMNEKGWFNNKQTTLHAGEGPIHTVKWRGSFIAWANDFGVKIYDCSCQQRITYIDRPKGSPHAALYRCHLCWKDDVTLLIGWADRVKVGVVREKPRTRGGPMTGRSDLIAAGLPSRYVEIIAMFQTNFFICGIAPYPSRSDVENYMWSGTDKKQEYIVLLAYVTDNGSNTDDLEAAKAQRGSIGSCERPELRIVTYQNEEISSDSLSIHGYDQYSCNDYRLQHLDTECLFYILSPKDIVVAKPRDIDDHISWLLQRGHYAEAMEAAQRGEKLLRVHTILEVGEKYLAHLIDKGRFDEAAALCPSVLGTNGDLWSTWVFTFVKNHQLQAIGQRIPTENPRLSSTVYEVVLNYFLHTDHETFQRLVRSWPSNLYNVHNIISAVCKKIKGDHAMPMLKETLADLYTYDGRYDKALLVYLRLKHGDVFNLIRSHDLFDSVQSKIVELMEFDYEKAIDMLIHHTNRIPIAQVVSQLEHHRRYLFLYLDTLFSIDPHQGADYHELQVTLLAEFARKKLMSFLRQSNYYPLEKALRTCEEQELIEEQVFLLGRIGNYKQALNLMIERLGDVDQAIEFAKEHDDEELWQDLISYSMDKPSFIVGILRSSGTHIDPIKVVTCIPEGLEIPGLRDALVKIMQDYNLQISLREGCRKILVSDSVALLRRLNKLQRRGIRIEESATYEDVGGYVLNDVGSNVNLIVTNNGQVFHEQYVRKTRRQTVSQAMMKKSSSMGHASQF